MKRLLEEARRMIKISSISADGNEEIANYFSSLLKERGLKVQLQQVMHSIETVSKRQFNVIGILGDEVVDRKTRKGLLLISHLDTVSPGRLVNWTETNGNPFQATIKDGKIFGLGTADAKLDLLCKLHAIIKFKEKKMKMPLYLVGTAGEELGVLGTKYLIKSMALNPRYVLVGAPTELKVGYSHKSQSVFRVKMGFQLIQKDVKGFNRRILLYSLGQSAHSANPQLGSSAILQLFHFLRHAHESGFEMRFCRLEGGEAVNKVPDQALAEFYLTSHQFEDFKLFFDRYLEAAKKTNCYQMSVGGAAESGVRFLPDSTYTAIFEICRTLSSFISELESKNDSAYSPPYATLNWGRLIQNPSGLELQFDLRLLPNFSLEEIEKKLIENIQALAARYQNFILTVSRERYNPGLKMTLENELVKICQNAMDTAGLQGGFQKKSISTEAALFFQAGYDAVAFGPGVSYGNIHGPNESNLLDHLEKAVIFYEKLIEKVCL